MGQEMKEKFRKVRERRRRNGDQIHDANYKRRKRNRKGRGKEAASNEERR